MATDKEFSMYFEVVCCYHPTEYDPVGEDGVYVKEIHRFSTPLGKFLFGDKKARKPIGTIKSKAVIMRSNDGNQT
jgi:hypothetical protein